MAFIKLTSIDGDELSVNTESITHLAVYDREKMMEKLLEEERRHPNYKECEVTPEVAASVETGNSWVYFQDGRGQSVRETQAQIRDIANAAEREQRYGPQPTTPQQGIAPAFNRSPAP